MPPRPRPEKLLPGLGGTTKRELVEVAAQLFTEHGYAATSLDSIVSGAKVTKGALYHHFSGKQAVFEAVFTKVEDDAARQIKRAIRGTRDPWEKALVGLRAFLDVVQDPTYQRVVVQDGPAILGYERFRDQEERSAYGLVQEIVGSVLDAATGERDEAMTQTFSTIFFGAMSAAGESVSSAEDPAEAVVRIEAAIGLILQGMRTLAEQDGTAEEPVPLAQRLRDLRDG